MRLALLLTVASAVAVSPTGAQQLGPSPSGEDSEVERPGRTGVLVMAHGGSTEWDRAVEELVAPLGSQLPTEVAFGMADAATMEKGLSRLRAQGVSHVAVVRLFLSGRSFEQQTRYLLGLDRTPPQHFVGHGEHEPTGPIPHGLTIATHEHGLLGSEEATAILVDRVLDRSVDPSEEAVLLLAHGMGDDGENQEVVTALDRVVERLGDGFAAVEVATLREDWADKRAVAEEGIRAFVSTQNEAGRRVIVVPARLFGFGPYADVLDLLPYVAGEGLLPHEAVRTWIRSTAAGVACAQGWTSADCP